MDMIQAVLGSHVALIAKIVPIFMVISIVLGAIATALQALGKSVPGILGKAISIVASIIHFLNGNVPAAVSNGSVAPVVPPAPPAA